MIYKRFTDKTAEEWRQIYKVNQFDPTSSKELTEQLTLLSCRLFNFLSFSSRTVPNKSLTMHAPTSLLLRCSVSSTISITTAKTKE